MMFLLALGLAALPAHAQDAQVCRQNAESCETACAVGALAGALASRGKVDGNKQNAECAARCEAEKQACLGNRPPPQHPQAGTPAAAPAYGPSVAECRERIMAIHRQSDAEVQRYRNDALASSRILYESNRAQRNLFTGDCAGHPEAAGYIAAAERGMREWGAKCVQFGGTPDCSGTAPMAQPSQPPAAPRPAAPSQPAGAPQAAGQDMSHCLKLERRTNSNFAHHLVNHCGVTVEAAWCTEGGSASDDCARGFRNLWTIGAGNSYPVQGKFTRVRWGACKGRNTLRGTGQLFGYRCEAG